MPELARPLGPPLGLGTARNATFVPPGASSRPTQVTSWRRSFGKGTRVELNISQVAKFDLHHDVWCCIWWSDGTTSTCPNSKCGLRPTRTKTDEERVEREPPAAHHQLELALDGSARGVPFEGIGALSAGADAALLFDYAELERERILDLLFMPQQPGGAGLQILKVEIGGDVQSTSGSESSHTHFPGDLSYDRGYEYKLMVAARARNPGIKLYALQWSVPGYIGGKGPGGNGHNSSLDFSQANIDYTLSWLRGARDYHKTPVDFLGFWNGTAPTSMYQ